MEKLLSICIPTLERCAYLCEAIASIFDAPEIHPYINVFISNNCSTSDYQPLYTILEAAPLGLEIVYIAQEKRLSLDEHMHCLLAMADLEYTYMLGDDDYFLGGQLRCLIDYVKANMPDLAIFNGLRVDHLGNSIGQSWELSARSFDCPVDALRALRDKSTFGAILVKSKYIKGHYFRALYGSSHAYTCFWFSIFDAHRDGSSLIIEIPAFSLVALRAGQKTYSALDVYFLDVPYEYSVYQRYLPEGPARIVNWSVYLKHINAIRSLRFLSSLKSSGSDLSRLVSINPSLFKGLGFKIWLANLFVDSGAYSFIKYFYAFLGYYVSKMLARTLNYL